MNFFRCAWCHGVRMPAEGIWWRGYVFCSWSCLCKWRAK